MRDEKRWSLMALMLGLLVAAGCGVEDGPMPEEFADEGAGTVQAGELLDHVYNEPVDPVMTVHLQDATVARTKFALGAAYFESETPFRQVSWMMDAEDGEMEYRAGFEDGSWTDWEAVEVTWNEGMMYNMLIRLEEPAILLELRGGESILQANLEFYEEVLARDVMLPEPETGFTPSGFDQVEQETLGVVHQAVAPSHLVISRHQWGAIQPDKVCGSPSNVNRMAIHHTAVPADDGGDAAMRMRNMQRYHMNNLGWCDIGYHFVVSQAGQIYQARSRSNRPAAHVGGHNTGNVGISFIANFGHQTPTNTQLDAGARIIRWVHDTHGVPLNRQSILGHREHSGQSTSCPGNNMIPMIQDMINRAAQGGGGGVNEQGCTAQQAQNCGNYGCGCVNGSCSGGFCDGTGCSAQQESNCAAFGCGCVDGECSGGFCDGTGCTAKRTNDCGAFGCGCVDMECSGGFCPGTGCTAKRTNDCGAYGCGCVDGECAGGFCEGTGCTAKQTNDCANYGCGCENGQCAGGFCEPAASTGGGSSGGGGGGGGGVHVEEGDCSSTGSPGSSPLMLLLVGAALVAVRRRALR